MTRPGRTEVSGKTKMYTLATVISYEKNPLPFVAGGEVDFGNYDSLFARLCLLALGVC